MKALFSILLIVIFTQNSVAANELNTEVMSLSQWRNQQVINAENRVVRLSNQITTVKYKTGKLNDIRSLESSRRVALQNIELAKELTIEDYFNVYLNQFSDSDAALANAAKGMSRTEVASLLKLLLQSKSKAATIDHQSSSSVITGITTNSSNRSRL